MFSAPRSGPAAAGAEEAGRPLQLDAGASMEQQWTQEEASQQDGQPRPAESRAAAAEVGISLQRGAEAATERNVLLPLPLPPPQRPPQERKDALQERQRQRQQAELKDDNDEETHQPVGDTQRQEEQDGQPATGLARKTQPATVPQAQAVQQAR